MAKEIFTPSELAAEQDVSNVVLNWVQKNSGIPGFIISRNEDDGVMTELTKVEKTATTWWW